jgi:hypothetical protein
MKIFQILTLSELGGAQSVVINLSNALTAKQKCFDIIVETDLFRSAL